MKGSYRLGFYAMIFSTPSPFIYLFIFCLRRSNKKIDQFVTTAFFCTSKPVENRLEFNDVRHFLRTMIFVRYLDICKSKGFAVGDEKTCLLERCCP